MPERKVWFIGDRDGKAATLRVKLGKGLVVSAAGWYRDEGSCIDYFADCAVADPKAMAGLSVQSEVVKLPEVEAPAAPSRRRRPMKSTVDPTTLDKPAAPPTAPEPPPKPEPQGSLFG